MNYLPRHLTIFLLLLVLAGCRSTGTIYVQSSKLPVNEYISDENAISKFIFPYKDSLEVEMNRVIGYASADLERARPEGALGNFMLDMTLSYINSSYFYKKEHSPYIAIMNYGGLRAPIAKGVITVGDIYKLMPFDNTIVLLRMNVKDLEDIVAYIHESGGEPIAGFTIQGKSIELSDEQPLSDTITVITTDYLADGGDRMDFFKKAYSIEKTGLLLREVLINRVEEADTIHPVLDQRIILK